MDTAVWITGVGMRGCPMKYGVVASCGMGRAGISRNTLGKELLCEKSHTGIKQDYGMVVRRPQLSLFQKINS